MTAFVCAGPSLFDVPDDALYGLTRHPPLGRGDVLRLVQAGATSILVIDGFFGDRPSLGHKEIHFALSRGIVVAGATSMGALRAVECGAVGMLGLGEIYQEYSDGRRISDADVAVAHGPEALDWRPLSLALVDIEATLDAARDHLGHDLSNRLLKGARSLFFAQRTWPEILVTAQVDTGLSDWLAHHTIRRKTADALHAIQTFATGLPEPSTRPFVPTETFATDVSRYAAEVCAVA